MKYLTRIISSIIIALFIIPNSFANSYLCNKFLNELEILERETESTGIPQTPYIWLGIGFNYIEDKDPDFQSLSFTSKVKRNKKNYPLVGPIYNFDTLKIFKNGDTIISVDGIDLSKLSDQELAQIFYEGEEGTIHDIVFMRDKILLDAEVEKKREFRTNRTLNFALENINDIDLIKSTVTFTGTFDTELYYSESANWAIVELAKEILTGTTEKGTPGAQTCENISTEYARKKNLPIPSDAIAIKDIYLQDNDLIENHVFFKPYNDDYDKNLIQLETTSSSTGTWEIKNDFNLVSFPFDKQKISIKITNLDSFDQSFIDISDISYRLINNYYKKIKIPGWDIDEIQFEVKNNLDFNNVPLFDAVLEIDIERQSFYYIFKIILPITLILFVCWSSVWINRKEIESKLTITIVCLLSLIAYNFVIDKEIPKLEYLTIMDWIILTSYVYAALPNILAIITFQLGDQFLYKNYDLKITEYSKKYGILSYFLFVILIILINVTTVPNYTIDALSWAMLK